MWSNWSSVPDLETFKNLGFMGFGLDIYRYFLIRKTCDTIVDCIIYSIIYSISNLSFNMGMCRSKCKTIVNDRDKRPALGASLVRVMGYQVLTHIQTVVPCGVVGGSLPLCTNKSNKKMTYQGPCSKTTPKKNWDLSCSDMGVVRNQCHYQILLHNGIMGRAGWSSACLMLGVFIKVQNFKQPPNDSTGLECSLQGLDWCQFGGYPAW